MNRTSIRFLIVFGACTMIAIVLVQIYWVSQAVHSQEEQFDRSVQMALRNVVESLCLINGNDIPANDPIDQLSNNYFIARTNYMIDLPSLDYLLKAELQKKNIQMDYEYGVYDCQTDRMVYGDYVILDDQTGQENPQGYLPKLADDEYYFAVFFPQKDQGILDSLGFWKITTGLTVLILLFFSYALFVILRQRRLSEIQRDFINNMTHEFKTPLSTLRVSADVLKNEHLSERFSAYIHIIDQELERLQSHVSRLLETASAEHLSKRSLEPVDIREKICRVVERFEKDRPKINIETPDHEVWVKAHPDTLETVIFNLIDNALKYGKDYISIRLKHNRHVELTVTNDGDTIPAKDLGRVFKKFYRVHKGDLHDVKGFGLGLYYARQGIKAMNGQIGVTLDELGRTKFYIRLKTASQFQKKT